MLIYRSFMILLWVYRIGSVHMQRQPFELLKGSGMISDECPLFINRVEEGRGFHYIWKDEDGHRPGSDERLDVSKGDFFVLPMGTKHVFRPTSSAADLKFVVYNCIFRMDWFKSLVEHQSFLPSMIVDRISGLDSGLSWLNGEDHFGEIDRIFNQLYVEYSRKYTGYQMKLLGLFLELAGSIYRMTEQHHHSNSEDDKSDWIDHALSMIHSRFIENGLRAEDISRPLGISVGHFHRSFKQHVGIAFNAYIQTLRVEESCRLLRQTSHKISTIAPAVGYLDMKYFHQLFKRKTGVTPHQYRKNKKD